MFSLLLKKALPFTLTFALGAALSGLAGLFGAPGKKGEAASVKHGHGYGRRACRMRAHKLVAESKPLVIRFKPDARLPREFSKLDDGALSHFTPRSALVRVTFGADGKVEGVEPFYENSFGLDRLPLDPHWKKAWDNVERAARMIQFTPEVNNGLPVSVTKELEIFFFQE